MASPTGEKPVVYIDTQTANTISESVSERTVAPIVTTIEPDAPWYPAEDYHQGYWEGEGQRNPYCLAVIPPKLAKLRNRDPSAFFFRAKGTWPPRQD